MAGDGGLINNIFKLNIKNLRAIQVSFDCRGRERGDCFDIHRGISRGR